jgi:hypothetical protein
MMPEGMATKEGFNMTRFRLLAAAGVSAALSISAHGVARYTECFSC